MIASLRIATLGILGISLVACREPQQAPPTPQVTVAPAIARDVADWDRVHRTLRSRSNAVDVRPRVAGFIQRVAFHRGRDRPARAMRCSRSTPGPTKPKSRAPRRSSSRPGRGTARPAGARARASASSTRRRSLVKSSTARTSAAAPKAPRRRSRRGGRAASWRSSTSSGRSCARRSRVAWGAPRSRRAISCRRVRRRRRCSRRSSRSIRSMSTSTADEQRLSQIRRCGHRAARRRRRAPVQIGLVDETGFPHEGTARLRRQPRRPELPARFASALC